MLLPRGDFQELDVTLGVIFLDPNNPRFETKVKVADSSVKELTVQQSALARMDDFGIDDLKESIKKVGFVQIDKIVVRPLKPDGFVVVEGNRRVAALKSLEKELNEKEIELEEDVRNSILNLKVIRP
jgi:ParB-like chromosome segregation protein Spo0J